MPSVPSAHENRPLIVIAQAVDAASGENPYTKLLYAGMKGESVVVHPYSRRALVALRPDVIHIHWPEFLVGNHSNPLKALNSVMKEIGLLWLARRRGAKLIWTAHTLDAHDRSGAPAIYRRFTALFHRMVDRIISLSPAALDAVRQRHPAIAATPGDIVPHGHYIGYYPDTPATSPRIAEVARAVAGRPTYLIFGQIRPYKNVTGLMQDFVAGDDEARLVIAGEVRGPGDFRDTVRQRAADTPGVHLIPERVADSDVHALHALADVIVLPYALGSTLNSGAAILALSLAKPVLVRDTPTMRDLQAMVGAEWVGLFDGTPGDALAAARLLHSLRRPAAPDLSRMDPALTARQTLATYRAALAP